MRVMASKQYTIAPHVFAQAENLGIFGETAEARLKQMAKLAARFTHPEANHRWRDFILYIENDGLVTFIDTMDKQEARYFDRRPYEERKAEEDPGEATVEYKDGRKSPR